MQVPEGETREFLGQEFLTWLWYRGETDHWSIDFTPQERISYGMDETLALEPEDPTSCSHKLSGPMPVSSPEAQIGLLEGKKVASARLFLVYGDREWSVTCDENFQFSSLRLRKPTTSDADDRFAEMVEDMEEVLSLFDRMYLEFLKIRLAPKWEKEELPAICKWAGNKQNSLMPDS